MTGKAIPINKAAFQPPIAYAHPPVAEPIAPPAKKIAMYKPLSRLRNSAPNEKMARWPRTRFAETPMSNRMAEITKVTNEEVELPWITRGRIPEIITKANANPVADRAQPLSARRPATGAATAPDTPSNANRETSFCEKWKIGLVNNSGTVVQNKLKVANTHAW